MSALKDHAAARLATATATERLDAKKAVLDYLSGSASISASSVVSSAVAMKVSVPYPSHELANLLDLQAQVLAKVEGGECQASLEALRSAVECGLAAAGGPGVMPGQKKKAQLRREAKLRALEVGLGLVDVEAEEAEAKEEDERRRERTMHHRRRKERRKGDSRTGLEELRGAMEEMGGRWLRNDLCGLCAEGGEVPARIDWGSIPGVLKVRFALCCFRWRWRCCYRSAFSSLTLSFVAAALPVSLSSQPSSSEGGGISRRDRVTRKVWQLESLEHALDLVMKARRTGREGRPLKVVDFGSGSGNSALVLAALHPEAAFTLVDNKDDCIRLVDKRAEEAGLNNVVGHLGEVSDFRESFDVGLAVHLCGAATDEAQKACMEAEADFILVPCCVGKIEMGCRESEREATYPRSSFFRSKLPTSEYLKLTRVADFSDGGGEGTADETAGLAKKMVDYDRAKAGEERGYVMTVGKMVPLVSTVKNDVIVGLKRSPGVK